MLRPPTNSGIACYSNCQTKGHPRVGQNTSSPPDRDILLNMDDDALLRQCRVDTFRGTGRGGQKRNRTDSAVRLTLQGEALAVNCDKTRSQIHNREEALRLLRHAIALQLRRAPIPGFSPDQRPNPGKPAYALWMAQTLDHLEAVGYRMADAAQAMGVSTNRLSKTLARDSQLWQHVNQQRAAHGLTSLRAP